MNRTIIESHAFQNYRHQTKNYLIKLTLKIEKCVVVQISMINMKANTGFKHQHPEAHVQPPPPTIQVFHVRRIVCWIAAAAQAHAESMTKMNQVVVAHFAVFVPCNIAFNNNEVNKNEINNDMAFEEENLISYLTSRLINSMLDLSWMLRLRLTSLR